MSERDLPTGTGAELPAGVVEAIVRSVGAVRLRDLPRVAYIWSQANSPVTRRYVGSWLLPFPLWLVTAIAQRRSLILVDRHACLQLDNPSEPIKVDWLLGAPSLLILTSAAVAIGSPAFVYVMLGLVLMVPDVVMADRARRSQDLPGLRSAARTGRQLMVTAVAAHPRGSGHGSALLSKVGISLDEQNAPAVLDARPDSRLVALYEEHGFRRIKSDEGCYRMTRQVGASTATSTPS